ncbi:MAG TPA: spore coat protein CotH [Cytophagales bacterium]|nr:spore coat protein CotH [Cytophagales bacterium]
MIYGWLLLLVLGISCEEPTEQLIIDEDVNPIDWTDLTHGNKVDPDYDAIFPQNRVNTLEIILGSANWQGIKTNMKDLFGYDFGSLSAPSNGIPASEPQYVPVSVKFNGKEWYKVGFRLKGNSTLGSSWRNGIYKLPFRLNFDRFEDAYPQLKNQRMYGFKELSMSPGAMDPSLLREKVGSDIFRMAGIPSARTAFYKVYIDFGAGLKYCGVYTMVEVVDDTMIKEQFGSDTGNLYKPESTFVSFVLNKFEKKNNETENNYDDVVSLINTLHSSLRLQNPEQWRTSLESIFDVDHFMKWLAINTAMQNWDTYGRMAHNYYLYNDPANGLTWIPWDNNESLSNRGNTTLTIGLETVTNQWPLIRYLMDDEVYAARYREHMQQFLNEVFTTTTIYELLDKHYDLISPFVVGPQETESGKYSQLPNTNAFTTAQTTLKQHVATRIQVATEYLQED